MTKPNLILGLATLAALAPLAWAGLPATPGGQAAQSRRSTATSPQPQSKAAAARSGSGQQNALGVAGGTNVSAELLTTLNAKKLKPGQRVVARVTQNVKQNGRVVIRKGSRLLGHVTSVQATGKGSAGSSVGVAFDQLVQGRSTTAINAIVTSIASVPSMPAMQPMGMPEPPMGGGMPMGGGAPVGGGMPMGGGGARGGGGLIGGTVGAAGGAASSVGSTVGAEGSSVGSTVGSTVGATGSAAGSAGRMGTGMGNMASTPIIVSSNTGAAGQGSAGLSNPLANAQLGASGAASNHTLATSTFRQPKGNLNLQSGSHLQFQVVGSAHANRPAVH